MEFVGIGTLAVALFWGVFFTTCGNNSRSRMYGLISLVIVAVEMYLKTIGS